MMKLGFHPIRAQFVEMDLLPLPLLTHFPKEMMQAGTEARE